MSEKVASVQGGGLQESLARWTENKKNVVWLRTSARDCMHFDR